MLACTAIVLVVTTWIYWPGIRGPELLDDRSSVLVIRDLQENPELSMDYVLGDSSGLLGRSVAMASFVLEKRFLDEGITGNKKVNIMLHIVNGVLVIWLLTMLFRHLETAGYRWLAICLGAVWLLHPLQVSTVLYVVQRMAMLSTLFMLAATISYLYWRRGVRAGEWRLLHFLPVPLLLLIALFSKENAIVLVPILLLLEVLWLQCKDAEGHMIPQLRRVCLGLIAIGSACLLLVLVFGYASLSARFVRRPFSLEERLLTESRILWDYVGQWFRPDVLRMGLYHDDVAVSQSLSEPATTLYAVLAWALVLIVSLLLLRWERARYLVFGVGWFLLGHAVESTVLPLELYFEHRNYYPAIGLLLVPGLLYAVAVKQWPESRTPLLVLLGVCVLVFSGLTSSQVQIWSSRPLLILNHLNGHPESARANSDMAVQMARLGAIEGAHDYSARAFKANPAERAGDWSVRDIALSCIAGAPVSEALMQRIGDEDARRPLSSVTTLLSLVRLVQDGGCPQLDRVRFADHLAAIYLVEDFRGRASANMYSNLAVLENALERYDNAYAYAERFLALAPGNTRGLLMKLHFATALGREEVAAEVIDTLRSMEGDGRLTVAERQTLALYTER